MPPSLLSVLWNRGGKWRLLDGSPQPCCRWSQSWRRGFACVIPSASGACLAPARLLRGPRCTLCRRPRNKDVTWPRWGVEDGGHPSRKPSTSSSPGVCRPTLLLQPVQGAWPPNCHPAWWPSRGWGGAVTLSPFPGAWDAAGDTGPQGCCEPGMRGPSGAGWVALPGCPICPWGQQAQGLACVVRQGPARLAEREGHWGHPQWLSLCTRQATHYHPTSPHP